MKYFDEAGLQNLGQIIEFQLFQPALKNFHFPLTLRNSHMLLKPTTRQQNLSGLHIKQVIDKYNNYGKFNGSWAKPNSTLL